MRVWHVAGYRYTSAGQARYVHFSWTGTANAAAFDRFGTFRHAPVVVVAPAVVAPVLESQVMNDDLVQPVRGFGTHGHRDMEIITFIVDGSLTHKAYRRASSAIIIRTEREIPQWGPRSSCLDIRRPDM